MNVFQERAIKEAVKELVKMDGKAIDTIARAEAVNQYEIYYYYINYHMEVYKRMIAERGR